MGIEAGVYYIIIERKEQNGIKVISLYILLGYIQILFDLLAHIM
jgi:hypothetical protein